MSGICISHLYSIKLFWAFKRFQLNVILSQLTMLANIFW